MGSASGSWREKEKAQPFEITPVEGLPGPEAVSREIDQFTQALKMILLHMEGEVDKVRSELGTKEKKADKPKGEVETSWIPMLNAEIVVSDTGQEEKKRKNGSSTQRASLAELLRRIPAEHLVQAGFTSGAFAEVLKRLEHELVDFGKQINNAVIWVRRLAGDGDTTDLSDLFDDIVIDEKPDIDTLKVPFNEIIKKVPAEDLIQSGFLSDPISAVQPEPAEKPKPAFPSDGSAGKLSHPALKTDPVNRTDTTARSETLPHVIKPMIRLRPILGLALLLLTSLGGGAAAYYVFRGPSTDSEGVDPKKAMVPLTPPVEKAEKAKPPVETPKPTDAEANNLEKNLSDLTTADPRLEKARSKGFRHLAKKEYKKAEWFLVPWIEEYPEDPQLRYLHGRALFHLGKLKPAAKQLTEAIGLDPDFADAYFELGGVYMKLGWSKKAQEALTRFIKLRPDEPRAETVRNLIDRNRK